MESLKDYSVLSLPDAVKLSGEGKNGDRWDTIIESDRVNIPAGIWDFQQGRTMGSKDFWDGPNDG